ncbi:phage portal protein [Falsiroseomonas oryzae]|uniref:phage portal protein n=1 Tax=Falsiroseomonas oryzae TaxID=2766473 RepID=UPI0022EB8C9F|nr:phage portal protein [Roseomonas sp. MO-31]
MTRRLRDAWQVLRDYDAAQDGGASARAPSGGSAEAEVGMAAATVARRARDAVRTDSNASRIVDLLTGNAVGAGFTKRWPGQRHADAWRRWAESPACGAEGRLGLDVLHSHRRHRPCHLRDFSRRVRRGWPAARRRAVEMSEPGMILYRRDIGSVQVVNQPSPSNLLRERRYRRERQHRLRCRQRCSRSYCCCLHTAGGARTRRFGRAAAEPPGQASAGGRTPRRFSQTSG